MSAFDATKFLSDYFPDDDSPASLMRAHGYYIAARARRDAVRKWRARNSIPADMLSILILCIQIETFGAEPNLAAYLPRPVRS